MIYCATWFKPQGTAASNLLSSFFYNPTAITTDHLLKQVCNTKLRISFISAGREKQSLSSLGAPGFLSASLVSAEQEKITKSHSSKGCDLSFVNFLNSLKDYTSLSTSTTNLLRKSFSSETLQVSLYVEQYPFYLIICFSLLDICNFFFHFLLFINEFL